MIRGFFIDNHKPVLSKRGDAGSSLPLAINQVEHKVMCFLTEGCSDKEIAEELGLTIGTIRNAVSSAMRKVNVKNRTQLALLAFQVGLSA